ncbi:MAG: hypothetical protein J4O03_00360 [Chloroflexi bacterium]|nr:hypothetical protein [Chloroflexota bacterium]
MGINIAGLMVLGVMIIVLSLMSRVSVASNTALGLTSTEAVGRAGERARTNLQMISAWGGGGTLTVQIKNTGLTSVFDYPHMDFIVDYTDSSNNRVIARLTYTTGALADNQWKKTSLTPDTFQPNAWDPEEIITLDAKLNPTQKADSSARVVVATPSGVAATGSFTAKGFFWFTNAFDISLSTTSLWQDIDLSSYVPVGTSGAIVESVNTSSINNLSGVVRGKEDTRDYMSNPVFEAMTNKVHRWQIVKVDGNRLIQGWIEHGDVDFKLRGYTIGSDPSYFANPPDITPATKAQWETVDVSAHVDADADGVILFVDSTDGGLRKYAIREVGSTFLAAGLDDHEIGRYSSTMYLVGINAANKFEAWLEEVLTVKIYLVGQTKDSVVYNLEDVAVADPVTGSWQELDANTYNVPIEANGLFLRAGALTAVNKKLGFRHGDSTDDWNGDIERITYLLAGTGIRADDVWDEYMESTSSEVFIAAYTVAVTE